MTSFGNQEIKAHKDYKCDACEWLNVGFEFCDLSFSEKKEYAIAKKNNFKIKKGDIYIKSISKCGGQFMTYRAIPSIHEICIGNDVFRDAEYC